MRLAPPVPEVQFLPAIFRRIQIGDIRIPAFQRGFVWSEAQVLQLLESVYRGFPIGSILFWRVQEPLLKVEAPENTVFPDIEEKFPLSYVLDGLQRLAALYGCFHYKNTLEESQYNVIFDIDKEEFLHYRKDSLPDHYLFLSKIFTPKDFLDAQRELSTSEDSDRLLELAVKLHSTFQEYMLPTVTISDRTVDEVVEIFERINTTGTSLDTVDFLRAVTWSEDFDLNNALLDIGSIAEYEGFQIPDETMIKVFAMAVGEEPTPPAMLEMRKITSTTLLAKLNDAKKYLGTTLEFLKSECNIYSYDFVPYEGQLLVLVKRFMEEKPLTEEDLGWLRKWFWSVSFNEGYRGRPDSYIIRDIKQVEKWARNEGQPLPTKLTLEPDDLTERVFTRGRALSAAVANLFATSKARSIFTGEPIQTDAFMKKFSSDNYAFILDLQQIRASFDPSARSNRILANIVLCTVGEHKQLRNMSATQVIDSLYSSPDREEVLSSQMISISALDDLKSGKYEEFITARAYAMWEKALQVIE